MYVFIHAYINVHMYTCIYIHLDKERESKSKSKRETGRESERWHLAGYTSLQKGRK
jgi:hypothetical protein